MNDFYSIFPSSVGSVAVLLEVDMFRIKLSQISYH